MPSISIHFQVRSVSFREGICILIFPNFAGGGGIMREWWYLRITSDVGFSDHFNFEMTSSCLEVVFRFWSCKKIEATFLCIQSFCCENVTLFESDSSMKFTLSIVPQPNHLQLQITSPLGLEYTNLWCPWTWHSRLDDVSRTACLDSNTKGPRVWVKAQGSRCHQLSLERSLGACFGFFLKMIRICEMRNLSKNICIIKNVGRAKKEKVKFLKVILNL